jgi:hypothetical protein
MAEMRLLWTLALVCLTGCGADGVPRHVDAPVEHVPVRVRVVRAETTPRVKPSAAADHGPSIGLIASDDEDITAALARGARRALDETRDAGGPDVALRVSEREAHWGAAAEAAVRLAVDEGAMAIIAPPERERAHAVAQLGTRAQVPIVSTSPWPSVMQAGSKWVTSVVPPSGEPLVALEHHDWEQAGYDAARSILRPER